MAEVNGSLGDTKCATKLDRCRSELGPQTLVRLHFEGALHGASLLKRIRAQSSPSDQQVPVRASGPQGQIEPLSIVNDPSAWYAEEIKESEDWIYRLTQQDIHEIDAALAQTESYGISREGNTLHVQEKLYKKEHFPLPNLGRKLESIRNEVVWGRGFFLLRGLPTEKYSREQVVTIYWAFGLYWGNVNSQNAKGHIIGHIKDIGHDVNSPLTRPYATKLAQPWHCDAHPEISRSEGHQVWLNAENPSIRAFYTQADIVGLLCLKQAKEGGLSSWASSVTIHNELIKLGRKDLVEELAKPLWWLDRKGEVPEGALGAYPLRIVHYHQGFLSVVHSGTYYELSQRHDFVPRLTEKQKEALQLFSALAQDQALKMEFLLQPGDIQLLNNHTQQHQRSSFRDHEDVNERRHLLRMWVSPTENRPIPEEYVSLWNSVIPGQRGGIYVKGDMIIPLEAE